MIDLDEAWSWYVTTQNQLHLFARLGQKHWAGLPWEGSLGRDDHLKGLESEAIVAGSEFCLEHLDDFAVLILFSVFESIIRDQVLSEVEDEKGRIRNEVVLQIVNDGAEVIEHGGFYRVLQVFKGRDAGLVEAVNQVRRYRNWVAHGRRTSQPDSVDPETAFRRLKNFLGILGIGAAGGS